MTERLVRLPNGDTATVSLLVLPGGGQPVAPEIMERIEYWFHYFREHPDPIP
jgi:hypothetical protein